MSKHLHTIEPSHGKDRLTRPRQSDVAETARTDERRSRNHGSDGRFTRGNDAARGRTAKQAITRAVAARAVTAQASADGVELSDEDRVATDALGLFHGTRRLDLDHDGPMVRGPAMTWALETALAAYYHDAAMSAGLASKEGARLLSLAHKCEVRAERAQTMALAADARLAVRGDTADANPLLVEVTSGD